MQLLSALTSTTSPLAMQAMPIVAPPAADFAALLTGMAPGEPMAAGVAPDARQIAALPGKGLPPVAVTAATDETPILPVSATEAVAMLPAAVELLTKLLPDDTAPPPEPEKPAIPVLPTPPRFALPLPRGRKLEAGAPREQPAETADDGDAAAVVPDPVGVPDVVVAPDPVLLVDIVQPAPPRLADMADASAPAQTILEDGSVVAADPSTPMRPAKRAGKAPGAPTEIPPASTAMPLASTVKQAVDARAAGRSTSPPFAGAPASGTAQPPASTTTVATAPVATPTSTEQVAPAIGRTISLHADGVVPVHVVVPPQSDTALAAPPLSPIAASARAMPFDAGAPRLQRAPTLGIGERVRPADDTAASPWQQAAVAEGVGAFDATVPTGTSGRSGETPAIPAAVDAAIRTLSRDGVVVDGFDATLRQPMAEARPGEAHSTVATDARRPVSPLGTVAPVAVAPRGAAAAIAHPPGVGAAQGVAVPAEVPPVPLPAPVQVPLPAANAAPVVPEGPIQSVPQTIASPLPAVTTQPMDTAPLRQPIAGEAAAPVVSVASHADAVAKPAPVTRIAMPTPTAESVAAPAIVDAAAPPPLARRDKEAPTLPSVAAGAPDPVVSRPVVAPTQTGQPTLDTRQPQWTEGMIDRIETLRQSAGANGETRIRLSPDALGDVEIAIRTSDDGKVHIHFNSENADAGRLLADAQPRLVQLAEARGLKLGGMQVDVGTQQQPSQRQAQEQGNAPPRAPRSATTTTAAPSSTNDKQRIA